MSSAPSKRKVKSLEWESLLYGMDYNSQEVKIYLISSDRFAKVTDMDQKQILQLVSLQDKWDEIRVHLSNLQGIAHLSNPSAMCMHGGHQKNSIWLFAYF